LSENFEGKEGDDLAYMPKGLQKFGDVEYDVRGIIQLGGKSLANTNYPVSVKSLRIHQKCQRLSFLHGTRFGSAVDEGRDIGTYIVRYATNQMRLEIPIRYGREVRSLYENSDESKSGSSQAPAWTGESAAGKKEGRPVRVYSTTWTNIAPDLEIDRIDFVSKMGAPAPFLIAITAE
jgi:hypothetical protein